MASGGGRAVLSTMLDRLLAGLMAGPNMNCRPHASRQRVDLTQLAKLNDATADDVLRELLGPAASARVVAKVRSPRKSAERKEGDGETDGQRRYREQQALLGKLRTIADEAGTYFNDTGVAALAVGFPLVSVPPPDGEGKRILAPVAFVPVSLAVKGGGTPAVELTCRTAAGDRVQPNAALMAWVEQQTGRALPPEAEGDDDADPWGELMAVVAHVAKALDVADPFPRLAPAPSPDTPGEGGGLLENDGDDGDAKSPHPNPLPEYREREPEKTPPPAFTLTPAPRADQESDEPGIVLSAVLGLFPVPNQGLLRDTRAMMTEEPVGPVRAFLAAGVDFETATKVEAPAVAEPAGPAWLAAAADPCQARAVALAREGGEALVVHGPPGTGKSQTITNVIADHLCRGERVLLVCDKRTALDVVADRLGHLGLRRLCGIVHDPRRDQRDLYRTLKQQLDDLSDARTRPQAQGQLERVDADLRRVHDELLAYHRALMEPSPADHASFSELVGRWLTLGEDPTVRLDEAAAAGVTADAVAGRRPALADLFERSRAVDWPHNPWARCGGPALGDYLARPMAAVRAAVARCVAAAEAADDALDPALPAFADAIPLAEQATAWVAWGTEAAAMLPRVRAGGMAGWAGRDPAAVRQMARQVRSVTTQLGQVADGPLDVALLPSAPPAAEVARDLAAVRAYLDVAGTWSAAFAFGVKAEARRAVGRYGLPLDRPSAERVAMLLNGLAARATLARVWAELTGITTPPTDGQLLQLRVADGWLDHLTKLTDTPALSGLSTAVGRAAYDPAAIDALLAALPGGPPRAEAIGRLLDALRSADLFGPAWLDEFAAQQWRGELAGDPVRLLAGRVDSLEGVLRVRDARADVPADLGSAIDAMLTQGATPDAALAALDRAAVQNAIGARLRADPSLVGVDARRVESLFEQYRQLAERRRQAVRDAAEHRWVSGQQQKFLAAAGTKLNGAGADLKRRLSTKGKHANRLRQVFAGDGGEALLDLCPVWMASPETVAQVFPRRAVFDVVIFDEASQCRLEEAIPVLVRGRRAVIAGDPHQLPPTRFFESGLVRSGDEEDEDEGDEQALFEAYQSTVEDLLSAALNLSVRQCYLDVHYRSRSADLIAFSNDQFYGRRLVPIPTRRVAGAAAVQLHRVDGVYDKRTNSAEADRVVEIVRELLAADEPPSIGIACLNLPQRDLIVERLAAAAEADDAFGEQLAAARERSGEGAAAGLFVKNLENVQGDERDQIIISTTYGPNADGRFHRRFGPLGMPGGGRRLNVLVTRARDRVHLVTSIPGEAYRTLPPVPDGQQAGGAWLLFAYLAFADALTHGQRAADAVRRPTRYPSPLVDGLGDRVGPADRYWGNDGFCVDLASAGGGDVGVLVDGCRYAAAADVIEWDVFRTGVLADQGWRLTRVWSPHLYRDADGAVRVATDALRSLGRG